MQLNPTHEIHKRRFGRNVGVGAVLVGFVLLIFTLTIVKISDGDVSGAIRGEKATAASQSNSPLSAGDGDLK